MYKIRKWLFRIVLSFTSVFLFLVFYSFVKLEQEYTSRDNNEIVAETHLRNGYHVRETDEKIENSQIILRDGDIQDPRLGNSTNRYFTVVLVHSAVNQTSRRESIRSTWLSHSMTAMEDGATSLAYWFVIGGQGIHQPDIRDLKEEQRKFRDLLILFNVDNGYHDLPRRTLYSMVHLSKHYQFTFLLKTDDDVYINTPLVLQEMKQLWPKKRLYWGRFSCHNPPMEDGRWKEEKWHWCDVYYPYAYGGMYVLTYDVVTLVANNAPYLQLYSCEDVSLGTWLGPYNLVRVNDIRIFVEHSQHCSRGFIAVHIPSRQVSKVIHKTHEDLKRKGVLCTKLMYQDLLSWKGLPQECETESILVV